MVKLAYIVFLGTITVTTTSWDVNVGHNISVMCVAIVLKYHLTFDHTGETCKCVCTNA